MAALVTHGDVLHSAQKEALVAALPFWRRRREREQLEADWSQRESEAAADVERLAEQYETVVGGFEATLGRVAELGVVRLAGKVGDEMSRLARVRASLTEMRAAAQQRDFESAGKAVRDADRELANVGGSLLIETQTASYSREVGAALAANQEERRQARIDVEHVRSAQGEPEAFAASVRAHRTMAEALALVVEAFSQEVAAPVTLRASRIGNDNNVRVIPPQELERLSDVGGLETVKELLQRNLGMQLEQRDRAALYGVGKNNVLLYGPPGTGKTMLARAVAGEYMLRYIRVTPAVIASPYQHEAARNLSRVFELARQSAPCLLFLDEVDALGSARSGLPSAEHRELVTQLLTLLEEYRDIPQLVIMGATNAVELLDPALREGRFDTKIPVPLPDAATREQILRLHLQRRAEAVAWDDLEVAEIARLTVGRSGAALANLVGVASERALAAGGSIGQAELLGAVGEREARDRITLETPVRWDDVILPQSLKERLRELVHLVQHPEVADLVGISPPAGILLYGPPGTGKTTIAKAVATEVHASFYEMSAADLLSKWVGESEERVARLFATARETRPSIIFIDEIDGLLRRRGSAPGAPWEERVVSQFLRELDGLRAATGVFLIGATNRIDIIDEAIRERRLTSLEVPLPDVAGRRAILEMLFGRVRRSGDVDLAVVARMTDGMSGADLKRLRDEVGMKALHRTLGEGRQASDVEVGAADFALCLQQCTAALIPD